MTIITALITPPGRREHPDLLLVRTPPLPPRPREIEGIELQLQRTQHVINPLDNLPAVGIIDINKSTVVQTDQKNIKEEGHAHNRSVRGKIKRTGEDKKKKQFGQQKT